jgi:hypothetical protein
MDLLRIFINRQQIIAQTNKHPAQEGLLDAFRVQGSEYRSVAGFGKNADLEY